MEVSLGALLTVRSGGTSSSGSSVTHRFQNFNVGATVSHSSNTYSFLPFGFSGVTINKDGSGVESSLLLPNTSISRAWAVEALDFYDSTGNRVNPWLAHIEIAILDGTSIDNVLHEYYGQVTGGSWDEGSLNVSIGSVLDAIGNDFPVRRLTPRLVGSIPTSSGVRLQ